MVLILLVIVSVAEIAWGVWATFSPESQILWLLDFQGVDISDLEAGFSATYPEALSDYRALLGGLTLMLGVTTLAALWSFERASWLQPLAWCFLGIGLARLSGMLLGDAYSTYALANGVGECLISLLLGIHAQRLLADEYLQDDDEEEE